MIIPPRDTGISGWQAILPEKPEFPVLQEQITADWVIVGAGWAGLAAARRLLYYHPKDRIVILDACAIASSPAGRNSGFMVDLPHDLSSGEYGGAGLAQDRITIAQNRAAIVFAREAIEEFSLPKNTMLDIGKINAAASPEGIKHNRDFAEHLDQLNEPYENYSAEDMRRITGSDYYQSGLFNPGCTLVQPAQYIQGLAKALQAQCAIYQNSPVLDYRQESGKTWRIQTPKGTVSAGKVILAVNGQLQRFGFYSGHLMHVFTYAAMTETFDTARLEGEATWGLNAAHPMGTSVRRYADRIIIRNRFTYDARLEVSEARLNHTAKRIRKHFEARFPTLHDTRFEYLWAGRLCLAKNGAQIIEELWPSLYAACCQNGLGTTRGTFAGMALIDGLMNANMPYLATISKTKPNRLPPEPLASLGANTLLNYRHWRAGKE